jgi:hypothetical protein
MKVKPYFIGLLAFRKILSTLLSTNDDFYDPEASGAILYRLDAHPGRM